MSHHIAYLCLFLITTVVFGDEVKSVSVMEGDSVTLHTDITQIQKGDQILWIFGPKGTLIAQIYTEIINTYDGVKLDSQTGSLTIPNIRITNSGLYKLKISTNIGNSYKKFNVTVYSRLPIPFIIRNSSQFPLSSISNCSLLCSVSNVRDVSLSWYKRNSLLSSISVSDLNIRLSLPLEVEYQDNNTYRCVLNNTITNQTQHLNINDICQTCSELQCFYVILLTATIVPLLIVVAFCVICCWYNNSKKTKKLTRCRPLKIDVSSGTPV
nr:uncharacterized protein LOC129453829 [Misgurnus anguillicaudatus]